MASATIVPVKASLSALNNLLTATLVGVGAVVSTSVDVSAKESAMIEIDYIRTAAGSLTATEFRINNIDAGIGWWGEPIIFTTSQNTTLSSGSTLSTTVGAGSSTLTLTSTSSLTQSDRYIGIYNSGTVANSEIVHPLSITSPVITLQRPTINAHTATTTAVYDMAERFNVTVNLENFLNLGLTVDNAVNSVATACVVGARIVFLNDRTVG